MGLVHEPLYHALNAFIDQTQERVNGTVDLALYKGTCRVLGRTSPDAIYSDELVSFDSKLPRSVPRDRGLALLWSAGASRATETAGKTSLIFS